MMWAGVVTQVVELLPSKLKALSSNPSNGKKKKKSHCTHTLFHIQKLTQESLGAWLKW
jgi:hypothetical protein